MSQRSAINKINRNGVLLVFPINNRPEPHSLWTEMHPRLPMRWEWTDDGDDKVAAMWGLMKRLSDCREVVYSKWYQGRATFFSRSVFTAMLHLTWQVGDPLRGLSPTAEEILSALEGDSPLSTKELKKVTDLQGRLNEPQYSRAMKELFSRLLVVAFGEVDDGAFPSLAVGATKTLYEDLWQAAKAMPTAEALAILNQAMPAGSLVQRYFAKTLLRLKEQK
ncbi:MAG: hypothetical protein AB7N80_08885 [Bdellovibrionales bacterium]